MARPRVFLSSTYYNLKQLRTDLETFVSNFGYEPVLNERGRVPYGANDKLETSCYLEVGRADMLIAIIGGRYGSNSQAHPYSISQMELKKAFELGIQVYIFVEAGVNSEYRTYLVNKAVKDIKYSFVDDVKIYQFLEEIEGLPLNNPIAPFETAQDITSYLREQWAGLFQRFLQDQGRHKETDLVQSLSASVETLNELIAFVAEDRQNSNNAIQSILLVNHPIFADIKKKLGVSYRVFFTSRSELTAWLSSRSYQPVPEDGWDADSHGEWLNNKTSPNKLLKIRASVFEKSGRLTIFSAEEWKSSWVQVSDYAPPEEPQSLEEGGS
jgi:hypothetical protein